MCYIECMQMLAITQNPHISMCLAPRGVCKELTQEEPMGPPLAKCGGVPQLFLTTWMRGSMFYLVEPELLCLVSPNIPPCLARAILGLKLATPREKCLSQIPSPPPLKLTLQAILRLILPNLACQQDLAHPKNHNSHRAAKMGHLEPQVGKKRGLKRMLVSHFERIVLSSSLRARRKQENCSPMDWIHHTAIQWHEQKLHGAINK